MIVPTDYKAILKQAKETEQDSLQEGKDESIEASLHASMDSSKQETVNLCVRVPKRLRNHWKSEAAKQGIPLAEYVVNGLMAHYDSQI